MANHARIHTGCSLNPIEIDSHVREIVKEKLKDLFEVEFNQDSSSWYVYYKEDPDNLGFVFWISDEVEYGETDESGEWISYESPKIISRDSAIEFRHGHTYQFMWWVEGVIRENLGDIYKGKMFDDGCEIDPNPNPERYETFEKFCKCNGNKRFWYPLFGPKVPEKLVKELNLDF